MNDPLPYTSRRSTVYSTRGMVSTSQPLATRVGLSILDQGGNAADAAVAVAAVLNLTEPCSTGIGGDAFCLFYDGKEKTVKGLNASGRAPEGLTLEKVREMGIEGEAIPSRNINSVTVPGAAAGWVDTIEMFGSGKLTMKEILAPAIKLAEEGYPISPLTAFFWGRSENLLKIASPNGHEMLKNGHAPKEGEIMKMPTLARTFRALAEEGKPGFYTGRIASSIVSLIQSQGGLMTLQDLSTHISTPTTPVTYTYSYGVDTPVTVHECPPNGQGITALIALGILEALQESKTIRPIKEMELNSVEYLHVLIETMRIAFADAKYHVADPEVVDVPSEGLLNKQYLAERAKLFNPTRATIDVKEGSPANSSSTVYFSIVDKDGNACSFINSNYEGFGTGAIPEGCGFTLQNRGSNFVLKEGHPNCLAPRKRPYHTIIPAIATRDSNLFLSYGVMGGFMQPQGHVQVLLNLLHFTPTPQQSLDAPRFCITPVSGLVDLEEGISEEVVEGLRKLGHHVRVLKGQGRAQFGRGQMIEMKRDEGSPTGFVLAAGSDPRGDGHAAAGFVNVCVKFVVFFSPVFFGIIVPFSWVFVISFFLVCVPSFVDVFTYVLTCILNCCPQCCYFSLRVRQRSHHAYKFFVNVEHLFPL
ncbi:gamma-glutamyltranspeptidase [Chytridium lagenaria]|nr:gamma-glutamyltranspeptidase [Chytridium lagenaria]